MDRRQWQDYTAQERLELDYEEILRLRGAAYRAHVATMRKSGGVPDALEKWADRMAARYGPTVMSWKNEVGWLEALLISLYGEEPAHWPTAFGQADINRATGWMNGRRQRGQRGSVPNGITYLDASASDRGVAHWMPLVVLGGAMTGSLTYLLLAIGFVFVLSALTDFWENELIDHLFRSRSYTAPTAHHIALFTAAPGETGGGTEVTGGSYARVSYAPGFANWEGTGAETTDVDSAGTGGGTQNRNAITFPTPSANWGTVTHFASFDAASSGNMYFYGALAQSKNINNGDPAPAFQVGALDFALA